LAGKGNAQGIVYISLGWPCLCLHLSWLGDTQHLVYNIWPTSISLSFFCKRRMGMPKSNS